jgi:Zn-dependent protease with chaperone function
MPLRFTPSNPRAGASARWVRALLLALLALTAQWAWVGASHAQARDGAREGVDVGGNSAFGKLVSASEIEQASQQQYQALLRQAAARNALVPAQDPQVKRLRAIAQRIIPFAAPWNERTRQWKWEVNLIESPQRNAFCMPGGKIVFYTGILTSLKLTDDEVAMVMGHEMAHALREHARERMGKTAATGLGANLLGQLLGLGDIGQTVTNYGAQLC